METSDFDFENLTSIFDKVVSENISDKKYKEILEAGMKILRPNRDGLFFTIATYITLQTAKSLLLGKLNQIQSIGSFLRTKKLQL